MKDIFNSSVFMEMGVFSLGNFAFCDMYILSRDTFISTLANR